MGKHILVDLDGTLAHTKQGVTVNEPIGIDSPGDPIPVMLARVKQWLSEGKEIRIFTARVANAQQFYSGNTDCISDKQRAIVQAWCLEHIGVSLPVVCSKDFETIEIWDDRAVQVERNTGLLHGSN